MRIILMCPKCGFIHTPEETDHSYDNCEYCKSNTIRVESNTFFSERDRATDDELNSVKEKVWRKFLYTNPQYDEATFEQRMEDERLEDEKLEEMFARSSTSSEVRCPKCYSTQIQLVNRKWSLLTGFLTNKVDRVCVNCKHKF